MVEPAPTEAAPALQRWTAELNGTRDDSAALAVGVFDLAGNALYLNRGMAQVLGGDLPDRPRHRYLVNPSFEALLERAGDGLIFSGWLTVGDGHRVSSTLRTQVFRKNEELLVAGEFDAMEMDGLSRELARTNQEINNLQRELIRKNARLSQTLEQLRETQAMLVQAEKMSALGQLVAGVAHEINNPMAFIAGNLDSLREGVESLSAAYRQLETLALDAAAPAEPVRAIRARHDLDFILDDFSALLVATEDGVGRVRRIVADLQTFSRLHEAQRKTVDLAENLRSTLALAKSELTARRIETALECVDLPPVECYPAELNQVFMNLIVNAIQAMPRGGTLNIRGRRRADGWIALCFQDTGAGVAPEIADKIFNPFFTTRPVGSGTGLGLSVSYNIVKHHGGRIEVESSVGQGAAFTVWLPERQS
ncbi:MAG: ATP-binding protein [Candidatus Competibacter sp.]|nr:ATP-binding protein [Candidatus Competibacter sp.]MDG4584715.1 ATP-binding protein [Candidatus Competibacter sp.]